MAYRCNASPNNFSFEFDPIYGQFKHQCNMLGFYSKTCRYEPAEVRAIFDRARGRMRYNSIKNDQAEDLVESIKKLDSTAKTNLDIQKEIKNILASAMASNEQRGDKVNIMVDGQPGNMDIGLVELVKQLNITAICHSQSNEVLVELKDEVHKLREENRLQLNELKRLRVESVEETKQLRSELSELRSELKQMSGSFAAALGSNLSESHYSFFENQFPQIMKSAFVEAMKEVNGHD